MPSALMILMAAERSVWWSTSDSVCDGVTTIDSPVWMPIGSMFSMLQMVMHVSLASRMTSYSNSFQPRMLSSTRIWWIRDRLRPISAICRTSASVCATPLPVPPSVNAERMISGRPSFSMTSTASSIV